MSGRADSTLRGTIKRVYKITSEHIEPDALFEWSLKPHHGAVVTFAGTVRDHSDGRRTLRLEYEAYAEMAEAKMREVGEEIREKWGIEDVAMIHRVGTLEIGEISILISVATPHRKNAFEACSYAIDRVKQIVPVWKKEIRADGEREWVERNS
ncbi:MAG: molybdenum cofactor biosynthesis protein MoaE [Gemmatimonadetes bacterium]|nr:molybdenum cofactor biosynthesis protein MoaE [Gemmatimonadota bacterium]MYA77043.1 molybdenum cofactor biosynthesis protein MoaE [Gemmatimonadota bacterium]MYG15067.1 molybdenum cofactor biosynthesis protein MoaE [Gemmatimonadota bacterium]MYH19142.1 molybdenum cofactor biosynthesis protein MoaE [Gemmatimonadota bacterium]MYK99017.1 molybdenum cofactor biosynthesis protein MoaE [Gemmatimonadota bacterium]